jgi:hypothetical protein
VSPGPSGTSPGEDFIELGLLFIVTGLTVVVVGAVLQLLILRGSEVKPVWLLVLVGGIAVGGLGFVAFKLVTRLLWFLKRLR